MVITAKPILQFLRLVGHQDWIRYGVRERVLRFFCDPDMLKSHDFKIDFFGFKYKGNLNCFLDWTVYFYGAYEKQDLRILKQLVQERRKNGTAVFVDVGANVGQHSLFMSPYCGEIHAFEPYERVRRQFEDKIALNNIKNIFVHGVGLAASDGELEFFAPEGSPNTGTGSFVASHARDDNRPIGKLKVVRGDSYISKLALDAIDVIKIDVEGFEKNVLAGLRDTLRRYRPLVFMEFSAETRKSFSGSEELRSMLPEGYAIERVVTNIPFLYFINRTGSRRVEWNFHSPLGNILCIPVKRISEA